MRKEGAAGQRVNFSIHWSLPTRRVLYSPSAAGDSLPGILPCTLPNAWPPPMSATVSESFMLCGSEDGSGDMVRF